MKHFNLIVLFALFNLVIVVALGNLLLPSCSLQKKITLTSPDKNTVVSFEIKDGKPIYSVSKNDKNILLPSTLGLQLHDDELSSHFEIIDTQIQNINETWQQPWGEEIDVRNNCNELRVVLEHQPDGRKLAITFRAFDDGFAFRYEFPEQENLTEFEIMDEFTEFHLADNPQTWWIPYNAKYYEALFTCTPLSALTDTVSIPLTMEMSDGTYATIHEANLTDYAAANLYTSGQKLKTYLTPWHNSVKVYAKTPFVSPWRFMILANNLNELANCRIMLNLNEPCKIEDTSWIQPMKYIGIWWAMHMKIFTWEQGPKHGATTENTKRYIDFAAKHNLKGVLVEGWNYGWDGDWSANGNQFSFTKPYPDYDIVELSKYAAMRGVKIIGHNETGGHTINYENQLDSAYTFFNKYGISDVKTGYVNPLLDNKELHKSQYGVRHYRKVIETAAKYHITIDNHEPVMPTGLQRTYPNLMSQEGVRGAEWDAWSVDGGNPAEHMTVLPFTRCLAGPADFTFGTFNFENKAIPQTHVHSTLAKQLALYVVIYSPLQMASDLPENYENKPAFKFIEDVPVDWSKSIVLDGKIGDFVITSRRDKATDNWYLGAITDENSRNVNLSFHFLETDKKYTAHIYRDASDSNCETNPYPIIIEEKEITADSNMEVYLAPGGGCAIQLVPQP